MNIGNEQLTDEEKLMISLYRQVTLETQNFLLWAVKNMAEHLDESLDIYELEKQYFDKNA